VTHLVIGQIVAPRGLRGELKVRAETEDPERFLRLREVFIGEQFTRFEVRSARLAKNQVLLQLSGIEDRDAAERWRGAYVWVPIEDALPLAEGEYYYHQIEGLAVVTVDGEALGRVARILTTGANDVYVVSGDKGELLLPAISDVIARVDLGAGTLVVRVPEGLR
jgi:16S rRNA processing protein RimM